MSSPAQFVQLAKSLPAPLQRFFARWPPAAIVPSGTPPTAYQTERPNPFVSYKHTVTGRWQDPAYSQRRQAELVKMAHDHGVQELLPETAKSKESRLAHRIEHGLRVKGTGVGQKVKGRLHERHMIARLVLVLAGRTDVCVPLRRDTVANMKTTEWSRGERPCWKCPSSSRLGRRYARTTIIYVWNVLMLTLSLDWQEKLDKIPEINRHSQSPSQPCIKTKVMNSVYILQCTFTISKHISLTSLSPRL